VNVVGIAFLFHLNVHCHNGPEEDPICQS